MISEGIASAEQKAKEASPRMAPLRVPFKRRLQTAAGEEKEQHLVLYTIIPWKQLTLAIGGSPVLGHRTNPHAVRFPFPVCDPDLLAVRCCLYNVAIPRYGS